MRSALLVLALFASAAVAEEAPLAPGARVRVTLLAQPDMQVVGSLLAYRPESLVLAAQPDSAERTYARAEIAKFERSTGMHSNAGTGAMIGGLLLGLPAALLGMIGAGVTEEPDGPSMAEGALVAGAAGAALGAGIGALIGKHHKHEGWEEVAP